MLCYLDKRFCSQPCANTDCSRNFNDDVMANARAWWGTEGGGAGLCHEFMPPFAHPDVFEYSFTEFKEEV